MRVDEQKTAEINTSMPKSDKMIKYEGKNEKWLCKKCIKSKFAEKHEEDCSKCTSLKKDVVSLPIDYFGGVHKLFQIAKLRLNLESPL